MTEPYRWLSQKREPKTTKRLTISFLLPQGWELIKNSIGAEPSRNPFRLSNPMTHALNTEKGRIIGALYNHALRVCRVSSGSQ